MFNFTEVIAPMCGGQPKCIFPSICVRPYGFSDPEVCLHYSVKYMDFTTGICETGSSAVALPSSTSRPNIISSTFAPAVASSNTFLISSFHFFFFIGIFILLIQFIYLSF
jgi:cellulose synthase/poly-beta-1,6-N-acetylglucosamine synthase-like glycosyltransferase